MSAPAYLVRLTSDYNQRDLALAMYSWSSIGLYSLGHPLSLSNRRKDLLEGRKEKRTTDNSVKHLKK